MLYRFLIRTVQLIVFLFAVYGAYTVLPSYYRILFSTNIPISESSVQSTTVVPVIVIGSGPAGLTAAKTILDYGIPVIIINGREPGGQCNKFTPVNNWTTQGTTSGNLIMGDLLDQVARFKEVRFISRSVVSVDFTENVRSLTLDNGEKIAANAVIIAMGTHERLLTIPGAQEFAASISYEQSPPDFQKKGHCLVLGGGIDAMRKAIYRLRKGATVTLVTRGDRLHIGEERTKALLDFVKKGKLTIIYNAQADELIGKNGKLTSARLSSGITLPIDHIAVGIGRAPNSKLFVSQLDLTKDGSIVLKNNTQATSREGVFAAGDITDGQYAELLIAAGDGMKAGKDVIRYLADKFKPNEQ